MLLFLLIPFLFFVLSPRNCLFAPRRGAEPRLAWASPAGRVARGSASSPAEPCEALRHRANEDNVRPATPLWMGLWSAAQPSGRGAGRGAVAAERISRRARVGRVRDAMRRDVVRLAVIASEPPRFPKSSSLSQARRRGWGWRIRPDRATRVVPNSPGYPLVQPPLAGEGGGLTGATAARGAAWRQMVINSAIILSARRVGSSGLAACWRQPAPHQIALSLFLRSPRTVSSSFTFLYLFYDFFLPISFIPPFPRLFLCRPIRVSAS